MDETPISAPIDIADQLCAFLADRCRDPNVAWPYHPRTGLGGTLIGCLLNSLGAASLEFSEAVTSGSILIRRNETIGGKRRSKRLDLVMSRSEPDAIPIAVEAKVCMTAHGKAHSRLVAELTSSLDAILDADPRAKFFAVVAINCGEKFTSPLNLPGPNQHEAAAGPNLASALELSLSNNHEICGMLILPIRFDNERTCETARGMVDPRLTEDSTFRAKILEALDV